MNREETAQLIASVISTVLKRPIAATPDMSRKSVEGWDSLKHVEIMLGIEESLGIEFTELEFSELDTMAALIDAAHAHHAA